MRKKRVDSGVAGVYWESDRKTWRVHIERDGKKIYLGRCKILEDATKLRLDAEGGRFPTSEEKRAIQFDKMARVRMRAVWREATKDEHGWKSFDDFMVSVGDRPKVERRLVAKDESFPIGPDNFQWVKPRFDHQTKEGRSEYWKAHRAANAELYRGKHFRKKFGITLDEFKAKLKAQGGVCAICNKPEMGTRNGVVRWLNVDHNHDTGEVRGLLCTNCNVAVGMMGENREIMMAAIAYLDEWSGREMRSAHTSINGVLGLGA